MIQAKGSSYSDLWQAIIRPNREIYSIDDLGPAHFVVGNRNFKRTDLELVN